MIFFFFLSIRHFCSDSFIQLRLIFINLPIEFQSDTLSVNDKLINILKKYLIFILSFSSIIVKKVGNPSFRSSVKDIRSRRILRLSQTAIRIPRRASKSHGSRRSANFCAIAYCETLSISALSNCNSSQLESTKLRARRCTARIMRRRQTSW